MEKEIINIPLEIPKALVDNGAIEIYARKFMSWTPTVTKRTITKVEVVPATETEEAVMGDEVTEEEITNPISALDACTSHIRNFVRENYKAILAEQGAEQGRKQALEQFEALFNE